MEDRLGAETRKCRADRRRRAQRLAFLLTALVWWSGCRVAEREMADRTPSGCAHCHVTIAQQWDESAHAHAWTDPAFVHRTSEHRLAQCLPCHASQPLLERSPGERPQVRAEQRETGVDCSVCHQRGCGYVGPYSSHLGPHPTAQDATRLPCPEFCGTCHEREHREYADLYVPAAPAGEAQACVQCHMPTQRARLTQGHLLSYIHPRRITHDHTFSTCTAGVTAGAVAIDAPTVTWRSPTEADIRFALTNRGAGHRIPSGAFGHRSLRIAVELLDRRGNRVGEQERAVLAGQPDCLDPGRRVPLSLAVTVAGREPPVQTRILVEHVDRERSFHYTLAESTWQLASEPRTDETGK